MSDYKKEKMFFKNIPIALALLFICSNTVLIAQKLDYDTLVSPIETATESFESYLVALAWMNNPENDVFKHNISIADENIKVAKRDWANDVGLTFNLNEANINRGPDTLGFNNFPRYNLGLTFNLGRIISMKPNINMAKEEKKIEEAELLQRKIVLRSEVLRRYQLYKQAIEIFKVRKKAEQDADEIYTLMRNRFREGSVNFDDFNRSSTNLQNATEAVLESQGEIDLAEIDIEEIIGISLEKARAYFVSGGGSL